MELICYGPEVNLTLQQWHAGKEVDVRLIHASEHVISSAVGNGCPKASLRYYFSQLAYINHTNGLSGCL